MIGTEKNEREMKDLRKWVIKKSVERKQEKKRLCEKEDKKNWSTYCTNIYIVWGERKTETERERERENENWDEVLTS